MRSMQEEGRKLIRESEDIFRREVQTALDEEHLPERGYAGHKKIGALRWKH